jgi:hypothetical protein
MRSQVASRVRSKDLASLCGAKICSGEPRHSESFRVIPNKRNQRTSKDSQILRNGSKITLR